MMPVKLSRLEHFADIIECVDVSTDEITCGANVHKIYDLQRDDLSHLLPPKYEETNPKNHLKEVSVDPDNALSPEWKTKFKYICEEFSHIINPKPGRYNGFYGRVDNSINFSSTPPPSVRARLPKYSYEMLKILGDKMDKLEEWGVLVKPEDIGVVPEFILPSMLMPKSENNEWRLVTDFTALNIHIKKLETTAPSLFL